MGKRAKASLRGMVLVTVAKRIRKEMAKEVARATAILQATDSPAPATVDLKTLEKVTRLARMYSMGPTTGVQRLQKMAAAMVTQ